jgi:hypothetical protein
LPEPAPKKTRKALEQLKLAKPKTKRKKKRLLSFEQNNEDLKNF